MKIERRKQLEVLGNDVAVLDLLFKNRDGDDAIYPGKYMPDGEDFRISLKGVDRMSAELRERMVQLVRGQFNAREDRQNAEKVREKNAPKSDSERGHSNASNRGRSPSSASDRREEREESLQESLARRERSITEELDAQRDSLRILQEYIDKRQRELEEVQACIKALQSVSPTISDESDTKEESPAQRSGSTNDGPTASRKRTTSRSRRNSRKGDPK